MNLSFPSDLYENKVALVCFRMFGAAVLSLAVSAYAIALHLGAFVQFAFVSPVLVSALAVALAVIAGNAQGRLKDLLGFNTFTTSEFKALVAKYEKFRVIGRALCSAAAVIAPFSAVPVLL